MNKCCEIQRYCARKFKCLQLTCILISISHIRQAKKLQEAVHLNLFPSPDMLLSLSKEFGPDLGRKELWMATESQESQDTPDHLNIGMRTRIPLDNFNTEYLQWKQNEGNNVKDFIQVMNY